MKKFYGATVLAMAEVNALLNIPATGREQDWEFEFSEPNRLPEFVDNLERDSLSSGGKDALALLLVASIEVAAERGILDREIFVRAKKWFSVNEAPREKMNFYWIRENRSQVPDLVRELLNSHVE